VTKVGGLSEATQLVSGVLGRARNVATTSWAQRDSGTTKCPTPGIWTIVALGSVRAAALVQGSVVTASKVPERIRVGI
jgi:hypothetical protein